MPLRVLKTYTKPPTLLKVKKIETIQDFQNVRKDWKRLLSISRIDNIFLTWEWLFSWWEAYSKGKELIILLLHEDNDDLIGIAPFYITYERSLGIPIRVLRLVGSEEVCSEYLDVIAKKNKTNEVTKAIALFLKDHIEWDILHLLDVSEHCIINDVLREMEEESNIICTDTIKTTNPFISLPENEDIFMASLGHHKRSNIKRREKKLAKEHGFSIFKVDQMKNLGGAFRDFVALHQKLWESRGYPGMFKRQAFLRFHEAIAERFLENNWLRLYFLYISGKPVASLYGFQNGDKFYYYQSGFDPDWRVYGVGTILVNYTIKEAISSKLKEYDFLRGEAEYKFDFTSTIRHTREILITKDTYKSNLYILKKKMDSRYRNVVKRFLPEVLVTRVRKIRDHIKLR